MPFRMGVALLYAKFPEPLSLSGIQPLINAGKLTKEKAEKILPLDARRLSHPAVQTLILNDVFTVEECIKTSFEELRLAAEIRGYPTDYEKTDVEMKKDDDDLAP